MWIAPSAVGKAAFSFEIASTAPANFNGGGHSGDRSCTDEFSHWGAILRDRQAPVVRAFVRTGREISCDRLRVRDQGAWEELRAVM